MLMRYESHGMDEPRIDHCPVFFPIMMMMMWYESRGWVKISAMEAWFTKIRSKYINYVSHLSLFAHICSIRFGQQKLQLTVELFRALHWHSGPSFWARTSDTFIFRWFSSKGASIWPSGPRAEYRFQMATSLYEESAHSQPFAVSKSNSWTFAQISMTCSLWKWWIIPWKDSISFNYVIGIPFTRIRFWFNKCFKNTWLNKIATMQKISSRTITLEHQTILSLNDAWMMYCSMNWIYLKLKISINFKSCQMKSVIYLVRKCEFCLELLSIWIKWGWKMIQNMWQIYDYTEFQS